MDDLTTIDSLPLELLEGILKHLVEDGNEAKLEFRLVCRKFNAASKPAFGTHVESTIFDIRSLTSMQSLEHISKSAAVGFVKKLAFTCCIINDFYLEKAGDLGAPIIPSKLRSFGKIVEQEYNRIREEEAHWYPQAFKACNSDYASNYEYASDFLNPRKSQPTQGSNKELENLRMFLADRLSRFYNLEKVSFAGPEDIGVSAQWKKIYHQIPDEYGKKGYRNTQAFEWASNHCAFHFGLDVLLSSMAHADLQLKGLSIPVVYDSFYGFVTLANVDMIHSISNKLEKLDLWENSEKGYYYEPAVFKDIMLSKDNFPALRSLSLHRHNPEIGIDILMPVKIPSLEHVMVRYTERVELDLLAFLSVQATVPDSALRRVELVFDLDCPWPDQFFSDLKRFDLDEFKIHGEHCKSWIPFGHTEFCRHIADLKREELYSVAKKVTVSPPELLRFLESRWSLNEGDAVQ